MNPASNTIKWTKFGLTLLQVSIWPADSPHRALHRDFCSLSSRWLTNHMNRRFWGLRALSSSAVPSYGTNGQLCLALARK